MDDFDNDGVLEADVDGNGLSPSDPEVRDYNSDGTRELPVATAFTGDFQFTCFHVPDDVALITSGPLTIGTSQEIAVFGAMRLGGNVQLSSLAPIDLRTSAWLGTNTVSMVINTALTGSVETTPTLSDETSVYDIVYRSICSSDGPIEPIPTVHTWGALLLSIALIAAAIRLRRNNKKEITRLA